MTPLSTAADPHPLRSLLAGGTGDLVAVGAALTVALVALYVDFEETGHAVAAVDLLLCAFGCVVLLVRRVRPLLVAVAVAGARIGTVLVSENELALVLASIIAFYTLATHAPRRWAYGLAIVVVAATVGTIMWTDNSESFPQELLGESAATLLPVAFGDARRSRAERLAALIDAESSSRVQAERLRISRDLHDVVAHGLAAIAVQSGTAAHNLSNADPEDPVRVALERINETGKRSLEDLRTMVGVLRSTDEVPLRPTPTDPNDLSDLVASAELSGIDLSLDVHGTFPQGTSEAMVVAAHRIAQEALTNVARHAGPTQATLTLDHRSDALLLRLVNDAPKQPPGPVASTGVGIIGMRERAESLGGTLRAGPLDNGGFEVRAEIPYTGDLR